MDQMFAQLRRSFGSSGRRPAGTDAPGSTPPALLALAGLLAALLFPVGCGEQEPPQPPSLDSPSSLAVAVRDDCGSASPALRRFTDGSGTCNIGLIANTDNDRLAVADLGSRRPSLADLDRSVPGLTHLEVGDHPIDVAASQDGTVGYTLNSVDGDVSIVDLWQLERLDRSLELPGTPTAITSAPGDPEAGYLVAAITDLNTLWIRPGIQCQQPDDGEGACSGFDAEATQITLPGRPTAIEISADGQLAYVVYANRNFMSAVALPDSDALTDDPDLSCRGSRTGVPCEAERIGLTYGCSDGVDNDGDGQIDTEDPQCWGPRGAESPDGTGRNYTGACADGEDNDGDGQIDRHDPDCQSNADDSESEPLNPDATFACSDGRDNDDDGAADYPEDPDCYGPTGQRESGLESTGVDSISVGEMGSYLYLVDGSNNQVLTVDADRLELVDAAAAITPTGVPFTDKLGITVGARPAQAAGFVDRTISWQNPDDPAHGIVHYEFGVHVASDNGQMYTLRTVSADCEVRETDRDELLTNRQFRLGSEAFQESAESQCLNLPAFPIDKPDSENPEENSCAYVEQCRECRETGGQQGMTEGCADVCSEFEKNLRDCRVAGRRVEPSEQVTLVANPHFRPFDSRPPGGRLRGSGTCTAPSIFLEQMRNYVADNTNEPAVFGCPSSHRDQPLGRRLTDQQREQATFEDQPRATLLEYVARRLAPPEEDQQGVQDTHTSRPYDFLYRSEDWEVTWEGILPQTDRRDGLLAEDQEGVLQTGSLDLCRAGVHEGDRIVLANSPRTGGDAPDQCSELQPDDGNQQGDGPRDSNDPFLTYRVDEVRPNTLVMAPIEEPDDTNRFADTLPVRGCFQSSIRYEVRPEDEWTVVGEQSGYQSERTSELGQCVPRQGADNPRVQARVQSNRFFTGPYLAFELYEGPVDPIRRRGNEYRYTFGVRRFFTSRRTGISTILPSDMLLTRRISGGKKLLISDSSNDFVEVRNLTNPYQNRLRLR